MVATLGGLAALLVGLAILLLPLLATELSRPRDSAWGAVMLLLGLVVVSSRDRLTGAPMLAVLCGGLLIGRLGVEVGQGRWRQLTGDEQTRLGSIERWSSSPSNWVPPPPSSRALSAQPPGAWAVGSEPKGNPKPPPSAGSGQRSPPPW